VDRIRILPDSVANQIAAGEVVERPASVVKELVENALDAGASRVEVRTRSAGRWFIEVSDDGCGMSRNDALLCLERHATSKLSSGEDLRRIATYGFRGEALPSIAAVSRLTLCTREEGAPFGVEVETAGGKILAVRQVGRAVGTTVTVRSLFFNVPARRKFLRSPLTERAHVQETLYNLALARPEVLFRWAHEDGTELLWPPCPSRELRLEMLFGKAFRGGLVGFSWEKGQSRWRLHGFIGRPALAGRRGEERFFVNGRPVTSRALLWAVRDVARTHAMRGQHLPVFLWLELPPEEVDVNVHPAKKEVRFVREGEIQGLVQDVLSEALKKEGATFFPPFPAKPKEGPQEKDPKEGATWSARAEEFGQENLFLQQKGAAGEQKQPSTSFRYLGMVAQLYLLLESDQGLWLVDQHAAHERILFEKFSRQKTGDPVPNQRLLFPLSLTLSPVEAAALRQEEKRLAELGFELSFLGGQTFLVTALPAWIEIVQPLSLVKELAAELAAGNSCRLEDAGLFREKIARLACRRALKSGDSLNQNQAEALLEELLACQDPFRCPHGRPTMIKISLDELGKRFGRLGPEYLPHNCAPKTAREDPPD
jgi:DNA mismatch repair protein MutL